MLYSSMYKNIAINRFNMLKQVVIKLNNNKSNIMKQIHFSSMSTSTGIDINQQFLNKEDLLRSHLNQIIDSCVNKTLLTTGYIQNINISKLTNKINVTLDLYINGHPNAVDIKEQCIAKVMDVLNVSKDDVNIHIIYQNSNNSNIHIDIHSKPTILSSLSKIKHIIAISSCKGGVGKSTIAYQIANELANRKELSNNKNISIRVGLLDADIYGPSVPFLANPIDKIIRKTSNINAEQDINNTNGTNKPKSRYHTSNNNNKSNTTHNNNTTLDHINTVEPLVQANGLKLMSFGYVNPKAGVAGAGATGGAAVLRGPVVTKVINQLIVGTNWGCLDYLIIDMPPGTGDIPITVCQTIPLTGAVIITTPHVLSITDVVKGIEMFDNVKVPTLSIIENMSYMSCEHGTRYYPFGSNLNGKQGLMDILNTNNIPNNNINQDNLLVRSPSSYHQLPLICTTAAIDNNITINNTTTNTTSNTIVQIPSKLEMKSKYQEIIDSILKNIVNIQINAQLVPNVTYNQDTNELVLRYYTALSATEYKIPCVELRYLRDASTGKKLLTPRINDNNIHPYPIQYEYKGNYGINFQWNDKYNTDIYSYEILKQIAIELNSN